MGIINGWKIAGFEGCPKYKERFFGHHLEREAESFIKELYSESLDIFIAHSNPVYGDMELDEAHRGFQSFNRLIIDKEVPFFFHGHLHDPFEKTLNKTHIYSVYPFLYVTVCRRGDKNE